MSNDNPTTKPALAGQPEVHIDPEFQALISPLAPEEHALLEAQLVAAGEVRDPLVKWGSSSVLLDGHNRYEIAIRHGLPYKVVPANPDPPTRDDAKLWIIRNQLGRRNLTDYTRTELALKMKDMIAAEAARRQEDSRTKKGEKVGAARAGTKLSPRGDKPEKKKKTRTVVAETAGVSEGTVTKVERIQAEAPEEVKANLRAGTISIDAAYKKLKKAEKKVDGTIDVAALARKSVSFAAQADIPTWKTVHKGDTVWIQPTLNGPWVQATMGTVDKGDLDTQVSVRCEGMFRLVPYLKMRLHQPTLGGADTGGANGKADTSGQASKADTGSARPSADLSEEVQALLREKTPNPKAARNDVVTVQNSLHRWHSKELPHLLKGARHLPPAVKLLMEAFMGTVGRTVKALGEAMEILNREEKEKREAAE